MTSFGQSEIDEIKRLEKVIANLKESDEVKLQLVYPSKERRNSSGKITICGGSYNPFHEGHRELLAKSLEHIDGSEAIAYVTLAHSLNKPLTGASYAQRLYMLHLEQERLPFLSVGVINDGFYRNWFHRLKEFHPGETNSYSCVMGVDLFPRVLEGNEPADYPAIFSIDWLIADRSDKSHLEFELPPEAKQYEERIGRVILPNRVKAVSSSGLKEMINQRDPNVLEYIAHDHFDFIKRNDIYF